MSNIFKTKGVAMQIEKLLKSDCFTSLKQVLKFRNPTISKFVGLHPGRIVFPFLIYFLTFSTAFSICKEKFRVKQQTNYIYVLQCANSQWKVFLYVSRKRKVGTHARIMIPLCEWQHKLKKVKYLIGAKTGVKWHLFVVSNHFLQLTLLHDCVQTWPILFLQ